MTHIKPGDIATDGHNREYTVRHVRQMGVGRISTRIYLEGRRGWYNPDNYTIATPKTKFQQYVVAQHANGVWGVLDTYSADTDLAFAAFSRVNSDLIQQSADRLNAGMPKLGWSWTTYEAPVAASTVETKSVDDDLPDIADIDAGWWDVPYSKVILKSGGTDQAMVEDLGFEVRVQVRRKVVGA